MRKMRNLAVVTVAYAVISYLFLAVVGAQQFQFSGLSFREAQFVADGVQDDLVAVGAASPAIVVKYVGSKESGTVDLNANAIELFSGDLGGEVINGDAGFDVNVGDVCGTANDSLDVTDTECDTPAELVRVINSSGSNWRAILLGVLGTETLATAAEYEDMADAQAKLPGGLAIEIDNSDVDTMALLLSPVVGRSVPSAIGGGYRPFGTTGSGRDNIEFFLESPATTSYAQAIKINPYAGFIPVLTGVTALVDSTGTWTLNVYAVRYGRTATPTGSASPGTLGTRLYERLVFTLDGADVTVLAPTAISATTPLVGAPGETFLIQVVDDVLVTATITASGFFLVK